ncbi:MAG: DEAD/DEAH box helicase [Euryarchaeota archaeon]|nr:DEAD/DEAH box helicase [Euryarchaeota archaeon]MDE1836477.1 DEAD/DEAH box helicase [Euryarchaeota archaeon]MDE1880644.1 DEAD/DEAH box helicase [Euryarchaeota archaeon]MDE2044225.1 DEAD/DEAH box helicase [Thermoplasmata archaeon]
MSFVVHPRLRHERVEDRQYQRVIADHASRENVLVVLPTGLGKTAVALRLMAEVLERRPDRSVLFLAPTRPLVEQHAESVRANLVAPEPLVFTGAIPPDRRKDLLSPPQVVIATPQVIANDVRSGALDLSIFSLVVFDEAHRASGDYPYVMLGGALRELSGVRVLGMTASPGYDKSKILEVLRNLGISPSSGIEVRTQQSPDVAPYFHGTEITPVYVDNPPQILEIASHLRASFQRQVERLCKGGHLPDPERVGRGDLLQLGLRLRQAVASARASGGQPDPYVWDAVNAQAVAMKASHAIEMAESQSLEALRSFFERLEGGRHRPGGKPPKLSPSDRTFLKDPDIEEVRRLLEKVDLEHPKVAKVVEVVRDELLKHPTSRVLVFSHFRDTAKVITEALSNAPGGIVHPARFVGQADKGVSDRGLSQKEQVAVLDRFRGGELNCLVATSVAEEGLDIPNTDLVVFYEPVPSEIRTIQRRGRTGRFRSGEVVVLLARGSRDVPSQYSARGKEHKMERLLQELQREMRVSESRRSGGGERPAPRPPGQSQLEDFGR